MNDRQILQILQKLVFKGIESVGEYAYFIYTVLCVALVQPPKFKAVRNQMFELGVKSLPVVIITGFSTGLVLTAEAIFNLSDKGLAGSTGLVVTKAMLVEIGPVLTAFMITGRVGSAMCAELGSMRVSEQIDAMQSMSVDPLRYLVAPRFISGVVMLPLLTLFSAAVGIVASYYLFVDYYHQEPAAFTDPLPGNIKMFDLFSGAVKAFVFGIIIVTISCFMGMTAKGGAAGVGRSTTISVVFCYCFILIGNFILTLGLNNSYDFIESLMEQVPV